MGVAAGQCDRGVAALRRGWRLCCDRRVTRLDVGALRAVAETLAAEAAEFVTSSRAEVCGAHPGATDSGAVRSKSTPTDPVTVVDTETERLLRDRLAEL